MNYNDDIMVSIKCLAYNHEKYIRRMLDGCLMQKVNFKYEIIVHEDASTDGTADILREYEKKYPNIVKPIYQVENQYKIGNINQRCIYPYIRGKYIALCEGDDYWTDPYKLQMQVDYLEAHPECSFTFHDAVIVWENGAKKRKFFPDEGIKCKSWESRNKRFNPGELIELGFIPTASIVARTNYVINAREFCENPICGDLPLTLSLVIDGEGYYFNRRMSAYRTGNANSATGVVRNTIGMAEKVYEEHVRILQGFNKYTNYKWNNEIERDIKKRRLRVLMEALQHEQIKEEGLKDMLKYDLTAIWKMKYYSKLRFGVIYSLLVKLRNKIKKI